MNKAPMEKILDIICRVTCGKTCGRCFVNPSSCDDYARNSKIVIALLRSNLFQPEAFQQISLFCKPKKQLEGELSGETADVFARALMFCAQDYITYRTSFRKKMGVCMEPESLKSLQSYYIRMAKRTLE